jgi:hypothetical protein
VSSTQFAPGVDHISHSVEQRFMTSSPNTNFAPRTRRRICQLPKTELPKKARGLSGNHLPYKRGLKVEATSRSTQHLQRQPFRPKQGVRAHWCCQKSTKQERNKARKQWQMKRKAMTVIHQERSSRATGTVIKNTMRLKTRRRPRWSRSGSPSG